MKRSINALSPVSICSGTPFTASRALDGRRHRAFELVVSNGETKNTEYRYLIFTFSGSPSHTVSTESPRHGPNDPASLEGALIRTPKGWVPTTDFHKADPAQQLPGVYADQVEAIRALALHLLNNN